MTINLAVEQVNVILWDEIIEAPLLKLESVAMTFKMLKSADRSSKIFINFEDVTGYRYERADGSELVEVPMLSVTQNISRMTLTKKRSIVIRGNTMQPLNQLHDSPKRHYSPTRARTSE